MKKIIYHLLFFGFIVFLTCSNSNAEKNQSKTMAETTTAEAETKESSNTMLDSNDIVGEWTLTLEAYDLNDNHILDESERKKGVANKYYYRFNSNGSCLIHSLHIKGHYEIKT